MTLLHVTECYRLTPFFARLTPLFAPCGKPSQIANQFLLLYTLTSQGEIQLQSHVWNTLPYLPVERDQLFIFHLLYITSQSVQSYVWMSLPYVFYSMCIFAYSIRQSIWPPYPRTLLDPEASPQDKISSTNNFLWNEYNLLLVTKHGYNILATLPSS